MATGQTIAGEVIFWGTSEGGGAAAWWAAWAPSAASTARANAVSLAHRALLNLSGLTAKAAGRVVQVLDSDGHDVTVLLLVLVLRPPVLFLVLLVLLG